MQIYIEEVFFNNFLLNIAVLTLSLVFLGQKVLWGKVLLATTFGATISLVMPLLGVYGVFKYIIIATQVAVMCLIVSDKYGLLKHLFELIVFGGFNLLLYGLLRTVVYIAGGDISKITIYNLCIPTYSFVLVVFVYTFVLYKVIKKFYKHKKLSSYYYNLTLKFANRTHTFRAYLDTGNKLVDNITNKPVIIVDYKTIYKIANINLADILLHKNIKHLNNCHYIDYSTISNKKHCMLVFEPEQIFVDNKLVDGVVGVSLVGFDKNADFNVLLSPMVL